MQAIHCLISLKNAVVDMFCQTVPLEKCDNTITFFAMGRIIWLIISISILINDKHVYNSIKIVKYSDKTTIVGNSRSVSDDF